MIRPVYADDYQGKRFDLRHYNCWHFAREVWRDMTGVDVGDMTPAELGRDALARAAAAAANGPRFRRAVPQQHGPFLALAERRHRMPHVGVYMRSRILSLTEAGVRFQTIPEFAEGFTSVSFFVPES